MNTIEETRQLVAELSTSVWAFATLTCAVEAGVLNILVIHESLRPEEGGTTMSIEDNKTLVRRFIDEVINAGNTAALADLCVPGSMFAGAIKGQLKRWKTAFPDDHTTVDEMLAEGDKVAVSMTTSGTNSGPFGLPILGPLESPLPPTGQSMTLTAIYIFKISEGKILTFAREGDMLGLLRQLGWTVTPPNQT